MITTINNKHNKLNFSNEREQSQACLNSAEHEKNQGRKVLNVPNLRFKEFQGEWEKKSLGEIGESFIGLTYKPTDVVSEGGLIVFRSSNIQNGCMDYKDIVRVNKNVKEKLITKKDDLLVCARNGSARLIGKNAILHEIDANQTFGAFMMVFRSDINHFVHQLLNTRLYSSQVSENLGARINQITSSDLSSFEFFFPKENSEMNKIAALLDLLDERIATQNKIIDKLQSLIKGISSRIFASIQGIEYRMGDIVTITNGNSNVQDAVTQSKEGLYPFFDRSEDIKYLPTFLFDKEAIIYPGEGTEFMPRYFKGKFALHQRCYAIFDFNEIINARFLYFYLKTRNSYFVKNAVGSTVPSLRLDTFQKLKVIIPPTKTQHSVSSCLSSMEQKCNVEKKILHKLLKQKQYLLRQMFI